jgi:hypothetical protein
MNARQLDWPLLRGLDSAAFMQSKSSNLEFNASIDRLSHLELVGAPGPASHGGNLFDFLQSSILSPESESDVTSTEYSSTNEE